MTLIFLATTSIRVSVLLVLGLTAARLLTRWSAAIRHDVLATTIWCALVAPLLIAIMPAWHVTIGQNLQVAALLDAHREAPAASVETTFASAESTPGLTPTTSRRSAGRSLDISTWLSWLWGVGALLSGLTLLAGLLHLHLIASRSVIVNGGAWNEGLRALQSDDRRLSRAVLLQSEHPSLLVTWGLLRPRIILPRGAGDWAAGRIRVVLAHEAEHIRRRDWLMQLAAELLRALTWFNPLAWITADRLRLESEKACDDAVLDRGIAPAEYAEHLVDLARTLTRPRVWAPAPAMARASSLERRVTAMLADRSVQRPAPRLLRFSIVAVGLALTVSIASFAAQAQFATLSGTVRDQLGGTIPRVTLSLTHAQSGAKHEIKSNDAGLFEFVGLPPGNYTLDAGSMGFRYMRSTVQVAAGQTIRRDLMLELGTLQETISVVDGPPASPSARQRASGLDAAATCAAQPNSGGIKPPTKIADTKPTFPASMRGTTTGGKVELQATIGVDGAIKALRTVEATNVDFEQAAQEAVRQWRFTPTLLNCIPVEAEMNVLTAFRPEASIPPPPAAPPAR